MAMEGPNVLSKVSISLIIDSPPLPALWEVKKVNGGFLCMIKRKITKN